MAVIGKIREKSTLVLIIIGGAIMAFVLTDTFSSSTGGQQGPINLAEVNDDVISPTEFDLDVQRAYENYQLNSQSQEPLDERTKSSIREQVWNQNLGDILIGNQMEELGLTVTPKELFDMVQGDNPDPQVQRAFTDPNTGQFNRAAVIQFLQNLDNDPESKKRWLMFERALKRNQRFEKFFTLVNKGMYTPSQLAEKDYVDQNTSMSFKYVFKPYISMNDTAVELSDEEAKKYYNENKEDFEAPATTKILYAYFPVRPSEADKKLSEDYLNGIYEEFKNAENDSIFVNANSDQPFDPSYYSIENTPLNADTSLWNKEVGSMTNVFNIDNIYYIQKVTAKKMAPDSVQARHILVATQEKSAEDAEKLADSLMNAIEGGSDFEELAMTYSDDVASGQKGGDLGWFTEGTMVKPFNDAAFSAEVGSMVKVQTQFGFHIIEVTDKTALKNKIQLAMLVRSALPSRDTYEKVFNDANSFSIEAKDLESFNNLVREKNVQRRSAILKPTDNEIQGLAASRDIVRWVRDGSEGDVSEPFDTDDAFVIALVENVNEKGVQPFEEVKNRVEYLAKQEKKAEIFIEQMSGAASLGELAASLDLTVENAENVSFANPNVQGLGYEPEIIGKAMSLEQGQMSIPIQGNNGVIVLQLDSKLDAGEPNIAMIRSSNSRAVKARIDNNALLDALKEKADIVDNRSKFY